MNNVVPYRRIALRRRNQEPAQAHALRRLRRVSFGTPAAIVTSVALIVGLGAAASDRAAVTGSLLILALADNLTDALGVHIYQESERLDEREAFRTTLANFLTRLLVSLTFVGLVLTTHEPATSYLGATWGLILLAGLSHQIAKVRGVSPLSEIAKHCAVALAVIALSDAIGTWVPLWVR
jgi:VIT1/CCC1 family predicted Fe2+/Mn2+ transporter